ncbi:MAG: rod shape-determining protein MreC, partial [Plesiomonas sp.]
QVISVGKISSRVLLISDATHAIPVQVLRNDIRVIASGTGRRDELQLEHIPSSTDIRSGDMLVTSGLGGRFPEGYPVGIVKSFEVDSQNAFAVVTVTPTAQLERLRYLLLLWPNKSETTPPPSADDVRAAARERLPDILPPLPTSATADTDAQPLLPTANPAMVGKVQPVTAPVIMPAANSTDRAVKKTAVQSKPVGNKPPTTGSTPTSLAPRKVQ